MSLLSMTLCTYISTVIVSIIMKYQLTMQMFKDIADIGYKINIDKIKDIGNQLEINTNNQNKINLFIPIYNLVSLLEEYEAYYKNRNEMFNTLNIMGLLEEMTEEEIEEYNKKRTGFHAISMEAKKYMRLQEAITITFNDGSKIWFEYDKREGGNFIDELKILKSEGRISFKSEEQQKLYIFKVMAKLTSLPSNNESKESKKASNKNINELEIDKALEEQLTSEEIKNVIEVIEIAIKTITESVDKKINSITEIEEDNYIHDEIRIQKDNNEYKDKPKTRIRKP